MRQIDGAAETISAAHALRRLVAWIAIPLAILTAAMADAASVLPRAEILERVTTDGSAGRYFLYVPSGARRGAPLLVTVHGLSRNARAHARRFAVLAERHCAILVAPLFPEESHGDYQRLGRLGRGGRADHALDVIVAEVAASTGAAVERLYLFGFSGGAQFAHRYAMAHPERVAMVAAAAAGWYTFPDPRVRFPYGIGASERLPGVRFDPAAFLRVPMIVYGSPQDRDDANVRHNERVDLQQGTTRYERARRFVAAMQAEARERRLAPLTRFVRIDGVGHSFGQFMTEGRLGEHVIESFFGDNRCVDGRGDGTTNEDEMSSLKGDDVR